MSFSAGLTSSRYCGTTMALPDAASLPKPSARTNLTFSLRPLSLFTSRHELPHPDGLSLTPPHHAAQRPLQRTAERRTLLDSC
ncbi:unnamed protein product [Lota lota]